jgi:hypothetical protein
VTTSCPCAQTSVESSSCSGCVARHRLRAPVHAEAIREPDRRRSAANVSLGYYQSGQTCLRPQRPSRMLSVEACLTLHRWRSGARTRALWLTVCLCLRIQKVNGFWADVSYGSNPRDPPRLRARMSRTACLPFKLQSPNLQMAAHKSQVEFSGSHLTTVLRSLTAACSLNSRLLYR